MLGDDSGETVRQREADARARNASPQARIRLAIKRTIDCLVSACAIIALAPLFCTLAADAALAGRRVYVRTAHIGRGGKTIGLLAFAMPARPGALATFVRVNGLENAPRLFNVLRGDLALIGPRPQLEGDAVDAGAAMRPGLLSPGKARPWPRDRADLERDYVENYALIRDLRIVVSEIQRL